MIVRHGLLAGVLVVASAGCALSSPRSDALDSLDALGAGATSTVAPPPEPAPTSTVSDTRRECEEQGLATKSLRPDPDGDADDPFVEEIRERGYLTVGVDRNTLGFSVRDSATGEYEGFEVDIAHEIARTIFGTDSEEDTRIRFVPVATSEKLDVVRAGTVDFTISANTMTCERWERVAFSSEYYTANQEFLVRDDSALRTIDDLDGARVCVTSPSSSQGILEDHVPDAELVLVDERIDCLVELQEGRVDAYFGHDSFQYGMKAQNPHLEMRRILPKDVTESHYGIAVAQGHEGFVRFVNGVLDRIRQDGTWQDLHRQLEDPSGPSIPKAATPQPEYRD